MAREGFAGRIAENSSREPPQSPLEAADRHSGARQPAAGRLAPRDEADSDHGGPRKSFPPSSPGSARARSGGSWIPGSRPQPGGPFSAARQRRPRHPGGPSNASGPPSVMPYYLHQLDRVAGAAHFHVSEARGLESCRSSRSAFQATRAKVREGDAGRGKQGGSCEIEARLLELGIAPDPFTMPSWCFHLECFAASNRQGHLP